MGKGISVSFSKNIISPGDIVIAEATYDGKYKRTKINDENFSSIKLMNVEGAETPIFFSTHFDEETFAEIRYISVDNAMFENEKILLMDDNVYASLQNPVFKFEIEPSFGIYKNEERIANVECFYNDVSTDGVLFECSTFDSKKVYQIVFNVTILKKIYVNENLLGKLESFSGADNKYTFTITDVKDIKKMELEVK